MANAGDYDADLYWGIVDSIINDRNVSTHPHLRPVKQEHSFQLKKGEGEVLCECVLLEDLKSAIASAPKEAIKHHLDGRNDFAKWVRDAIGDKELSFDLELIKPSRGVDVKAKLVHTLESRIKTLKSDSVNLIFD